MHKCFCSISNYVDLHLKLCIWILSFNFLSSFTAATKWTSAAVKMLLLLKAGLFTLFLIEESFARDKVNWIHRCLRYWKFIQASFPIEYRKNLRFWPRSLDLRSCISQQVSMSNCCILSSFTLVVKSGIITIIHVLDLARCMASRYQWGLKYTLKLYGWKWKKHSVVVLFVKRKF